MSSKPGCSYGLVVAAGRGRRFGGLKQFALLGGRPLLAWSLDAFERSNRITGVVVVTNRSRIALARRLARRSGFTKVRAIAPGGATRSDSVKNGLRCLPERGYVAVHDAARPFVTARMLDHGLALCRRAGPATFGYPLSDTVKRVARARIRSTLEKSGLFAVQTPQFFPLELLRRAHKKAGRTSAPDDCALVELLGFRPLVIPGPWTNLKITSRHDLLVARRFR